MTRCRRRPRSSGSRRTPTARAVSSTSARPPSTSAARWRWSGPGGSWCTSGTTRPPAPETVIPELAAVVDPANLVIPDGLDFSSYDFAAAGEPHRWDDYAVGEKIDHVDGVTLTDVRAPAGHPTVAEHREGALQRRGPARRQPAHLRRPHHLHGTRAVLQRTRQRADHRRNQRRRAHVTGVRRRHRLRMVRGAGQGGDVGAERRSPSTQVGGDEGPRRVDDAQGRGREVRRRASCWISTTGR